MKDIVKGLCIVPGCMIPTHRGAYCNKHYLRKRLNGDTEIAHQFHHCTDAISQTYLEELYIKFRFNTSIIGRLVGCSHKTIKQALIKYGVPLRPPAYGARLHGSDNPAWKGKRASYASLHERLYRKFGRPKKCSSCGTQDPSLYYDWANLTGKYEDMSDYIRLCRLCHNRMDRKRLKNK